MDDGALTKEIALNRELMEFFTVYQISADLLSFDALSDPGGMDATSSQKIDAVKAHAAAIRAVIAAEREAEVAEALERAKKEAYETQQLQQSMQFGSLEKASCAPQMRGGGRNMQKKMKGRGGGGGGARSRAAPQRAQRSEMARPMAMAAMSAPPPAPPSEIAAADSRSSSSSATTTQTSGAGGAAGGGAAAGTVDLTAIPAALDAKASALDAESALRATIIKVGDSWQKTAQKGLIASKSSIVKSTLRKAEQKTSRNGAFDLIDALTRSGGLAIDSGVSLHVMIASTHCFASSLMDTLVKSNVNPIDKVERSSLIVACTVQGQTPEALLAPEHHARIVAQLQEEAAQRSLTDAGATVEELMATLTVDANKR